MALTSLGKLRTGMLVAGEVCDPTGRTLIASGSALTERDLKRLRTWGIAHVDITDAAAGADPKAPVCDLPQPVAEAIRIRFRHVDIGHPLARLLFERAIERARDGARS